jgi:predicted naringenin-chalcone synthase
MSLALIGLGTAQPPTIIPQEEAKAIARALCCRTEEQMTWVPGMYDGTGITRRHMVLEESVLRDVVDGTRHTDSPFLPTGEPDDRGPTTGLRTQYYERSAPPLALAAAGDALRAAGIPADSITHLVTISCTGFVAPGVDLALFEGLGLSPLVQRTHVGYMGCHGALNGLRVAEAFVRADPAARVLMVAVELCSLHYHYGWDPQKVVANALFADGAAALVGVHADRTEGDPWQVRDTASCLIPGSTDAMTWKIRDHGFEMTLGRKVPDLIAKHLRPWLENWLARQGRTVADVASWAVHPGGPRILQAVETSLELPPDALATSREVLAQCGNMSSPTVLFILDRLRQRNHQRPCLALAFGPGLAAEAVLFD